MTNPAFLAQVLFLQMQAAGSQKPSVCKCWQSPGCVTGRPLCLRGQRTASSPPRWVTNFQTPAQLLFFFKLKNEKNPTTQNHLDPSACYQHRLLGLERQRYHRLALFQNEDPRQKKATLLKFWLLCHQLTRRVHDSKDGDGVLCWLICLHITSPPSTSLHRLRDSRLPLGPALLLYQTATAAWALVVGSQTKDAR